MSPRPKRRGLALVIVVLGGENLAFDKETAEATGENDEIYPSVAGPNDEWRGGVTERD